MVYSPLNDTVYTQVKSRSGHFCLFLVHFVRIFPDTIKLKFSEHDEGVFLMEDTHTSFFCELDSSWSKDLRFSLPNLSGIENCVASFQTFERV